MEYSDSLRSELIAKMMGPGAMSANALSKRVGIRQPTLSRWLRDAKLTGVSKKSKHRGVTSSRRPTKRWTAEEKLRIVTMAASLDGAALGELLRSEGLHEADLHGFREEALAGLAPVEKSRGPSPEGKRIVELERELRRKEKALAEAAALLVLSKKAEALWGEEGDDTGEKSGR